MSAPTTFDLVAHLHRQIAFSQQSFGPDLRTKGVLRHIRKEVREIEAAPHDLEEWIDVVLLACDGAWRHGYTPEQIAEALAAKLAKNEARDWPDWRTVPADQAIEHERGVLPPSAFGEDAEYLLAEYWHHMCQTAATPTGVPPTVFIRLMTRLRTDAARIAELEGLA